MVFQSYAVWPHMTVYQNVAFPLVNGPRKYSTHDVKKRVLNALELVQLGGLADRPAPFLSGGQQQRVALARALAVEPKVLLMDEPLSNLDARLREEVRDEIKNLSRKFGIAVLYVTHDQVEAMALADRVAVMSKGKVLQCAPPRQLYEAPSSREVCEFLGSTNLLDGVVSNGGQVETELGKIICSIPDPQMKNVSVAIRPEEILLSATSTGSENEFAAEDGVFDVSRRADGVRRAGERQNIAFQDDPKRRARAAILRASACRQAKTICSVVTRLISV